MNDSEEFKPSLKQINEDIRPTWEDIKKQSEVLVNKLGCPRSFVGGMLHAIAQKKHFPLITKSKLVPCFRC